MALIFLILLILIPIFALKKFSLKDKIANETNVILVLFFPVTYLFVKNLLFFNKPIYYGAMDGFASLYDAYIMSMILITYPFFIFLFSMVKFNKKLKGIMIILIALTSFIIGIMQPIGKEGYIADETGGIFILIIFTLIIIGICYILKNKNSFLNKHCS